MESVAPMLPSIYQYYAGGGISAGLSAEQPYFTLNNRNVSIYSGALHYFRVPKEYWRDRLRKFRAAGLNTVETYVPWNLHEPEPGNFDFGHGGSDMESFLDVKHFLELAQEEDLLAIVRPGPYICSEWEFGGMPSWLLREKDIRVRTSDQKFMRHVTRYFNALLSLLALLQFTKGGPIIAFQVENEYGSTRQKDVFTPDKTYLKELRQLMLRNGIVELLFTSDSPTSSGTSGTLPQYFLQTANFASNPEKEFDKLKELQSNKPTMAMEYWSGWFDHWTESHHEVNNTNFRNVLKRILKYPASVNMYMFIGGTNWGFLNGANMQDSSVDNKGYQPTTTSYDYDAPLTEAGDYTEKYVMVKELLTRFDPVKLRVPEVPAVTLRRDYPSINVTEQLYLSDIVKQAPLKFVTAKVLSMELLPMNDNSGQSYGYVVYRKQKLNIPARSVLKIAGRVCDTVMVLINGILISKPLTGPDDLNGFGYWRSLNSTLFLGSVDLQQATLELVVENWGRNNFGHLDQFVQFKGLWQGGVYINDVLLSSWEVVPLEFKTKWINGLTGWRKPEKLWSPGPSLYKVEFVVEKPQDTYLDMRKWTKGIVTINGFVLGRYACVGPQQALYLPAPLMKRGANTIVIFEHFFPHNFVEFSTNPIFSGSTCRNFMEQDYNFETKLKLYSTYFNV